MGIDVFPVRYVPSQAPDYYPPIGKTVDHADMSTCATHQTVVAAATVGWGWLAG
jgi:hypothetical protein